MIHTYHAYQKGRKLFSLFPRIRDRIILAQPDLRLSLIHDVFHEHLARMRGLEFADESRVPEFAGDSEILATPHQCVGSTALRCSGDTVWREVILFTAGDRDETVNRQ